MPIPEGYLPRRGDVVVVHATVKHDVIPKEDVGADGDLKVFVRVVGDWDDRRIPLKTVVGVYSRHFEQGERVRLIHDPETDGEVVAVCGSAVWVKISVDGRSTEGFATYLATELELFPYPVEEKPVDTSDIPETPKSFFEEAPFVEPEAESAAPHDPLRGPDGEEIKF